MAISIPATTSSSPASNSATSTKKMLELWSRPASKFGMDKRDTLTALCRGMRGPLRVQRRLPQGPLRARRPTANPASTTCAPATRLLPPRHGRRCRTWPGCPHEPGTRRPHAIYTAQDARRAPERPLQLRQRTANGSAVHGNLPAWAARQAARRARARRRHEHTTNRRPPRPGPRRRPRSLLGS